MPCPWTLRLVALLIAALTFFVSRRFGFTFLLLPLLFVWGSPYRTDGRPSRAPQPRDPLGPHRPGGRPASPSRWCRWPSCSPSHGSSSCVRARPPRRRRSRGPAERTRGSRRPPILERTAPSAPWPAATPAARPRSSATVLGAGPPAAAYDSTTRTESLRVSHGPVVTVMRTIGAWPPVWRVATHSPLDYQGLSAIVRTAVEDRDDAVGIKPLKDGERRVWRAAIRLDGRSVELGRRPGRPGSSPGTATAGRPSRRRSTGRRRRRPTRPTRSRRRRAPR